MFERIKRALGISDDQGLTHEGQSRGYGDGSPPQGFTGEPERTRHEKTAERKKERFRKSDRDFTEELENVKNAPSWMDEKLRSLERGARVRRRVSESGSISRNKRVHDSRILNGADPDEWEDPLPDEPIAPGDDREPRPLDPENLPDLPHDSQRDRDDRDRSHETQQPKSPDQEPEQEREFY